MPFWHLLYSSTITSFRPEILIHILILPIFLSGSRFFFYKIKESNSILFEAWSSSEIWLYFKRFERKKISSTTNWYYTITVISAKSVSDECSLSCEHFMPWKYKHHYLMISETSQIPREIPR